MVERETVIITQFGYGALVTSVYAVAFAQIACCPPPAPDPESLNGLLFDSQSRIILMISPDEIVSAETPSSPSESLATLPGPDICGPWFATTDIVEGNDSSLWSLVAFDCEYCGAAFDRFVMVPVVFPDSTSVGSVIDPGDGEPAALTELVKLVESPDEDPLLITVTGEVWRHVATEDYGLTDFEQLIGSVPDGDIYEATLCDEKVFVVGAVDGLVWKTDLASHEWEAVPLATPLGRRRLGYFACSDSETLWLVDEDAIVRSYSQESGLLETIVDLDAEGKARSPVARGDELVVLLINADDGVSAIQSITLDGASREIVAPPELVNFLRVDPDGRLWAGAAETLYELDEEEETWTVRWTLD